MADEQEMITARVGVYSGRENPIIRLGETAQARLLELLQTTVGKDATEPPHLPKLGQFYGFLLSVPPAIAREHDLPPNIEVRGGVVTLMAPRQTQHWRDVAGIEAFLLGVSFDQGHGEVLEKLGVAPPDAKPDDRAD